jgi:hypothetical protein
MIHFPGRQQSTPSDAWSKDMRKPFQKGSLQKVNGAWWRGGERTGNARREALAESLKPTPRQSLQYCSRR